MSDKSYDLEKAYDGNLTAKARLHYLENERHIADSPARMYGKSKGPKMESNAQEKKNLMSDDPIASRASGGSWMSKHTKGGM
jgi:hypothetical protein